MKAFLINIVSFSLLLAASTASAAEAKPSPIVHFEIGISDLAKAKAFYEQVFHWTIKAAKGTEEVPSISIPALARSAAASSSRRKSSIASRVRSCTWVSSTSTRPSNR